jgi:GntR family transcriptional regulator, rspAB operon transcriptional repressor
VGRPNPAARSKEPAEIGGRSKADQVYASLKRAIISGELAPASVIDKGELCERFGVSRLPISTAVHRLAYERLVLVEPQRGSYVAKIRLADVKQWMVARRALEVEVARECALRLNRTGLEALDRNLLYQQAAIDGGDLAGFLEFDIGFHKLLVDGVGAGRIEELLDSLRSHIDRVRRLLLPEPGTKEATLQEHKAIAEAIRRKDPAAAERAMRAHLDTVLGRLVSYEGRHADFFES